MYNETQSNLDRLQAGVGTKETASLKPARVTILGARIEPQKEKASGKIIGDKVICMVKHPDKKESIDISAVTYIKGKQMSTTGLWYKEDEDKKIQKGSGLAIFLNFVGAANINGLTGKTPDTVLDEKNYLTFKAY